MFFGALSMLWFIVFGQARRIQVACFKHGCSNCGEVWDSSCREEFFYLLFCIFQVHVRNLTDDMLTGAEIFLWVLGCASRGVLFDDKLSLSPLPVFGIFYCNPNFIGRIAPYFSSVHYLHCMLFKGFIS